MNIRISCASCVHHDVRYAKTLVTFSNELQIPDVILSESRLWEASKVATVMCVNSRNQVFTRGEVEDRGFYIRSYDRNNRSFIDEIKCQCDHIKRFIGCIYEHPADPNDVIETCPENAEQNAVIYTKAAVSGVCTGPPGNILGVDTEGHLLELKWKGKQLECIHSLKTNLTSVQHMCYVEKYDMVVLSCPSTSQVWAVKLRDGSNLRQIKVSRENVIPCGLCHDSDRGIYVTNTRGGVIVIDCCNGELLQYLIQDVKFCYDVCWTSYQPQLTLLHGNIIGTFKISKK